MANKHRTPRRRSVLNEVSEIFSGISFQFVRKYLFIRTDRKALFYLAALTVLSLFAAYFPLPNHYYLVQKENFLNDYFVKWGWFWTCIVVCPFVWHVSVALGEGMNRIALHMCRMIIATFFWYVCTHGFLVFEQMTGHCHGSKLSPRSKCTLDGGKWIPGFDISGHCFLLIYSTLIMCEESLAYRNITHVHRTSGSKALENERLIYIYFYALGALHFLWDFELLISVLYYHHVYHKLLAALIAVFCWYFTYHIWYRRLAVPPAPFKKTKTR